MTVRQEFHVAPAGRAKGFPDPVAMRSTSNHVTLISAKHLGTENSTMFETLQELPRVTDSLNWASWSAPEDTLDRDCVNDPRVVLQTASEHPGTWRKVSCQVWQVRRIIADPFDLVCHLPQVIIAKKIGGERAQTSSNRGACRGTR